MTEIFLIEVGWRAVLHMETMPRDLRWFRNVYQKAENRRYAAEWMRRG